MKKTSIFLFSLLCAAALSMTACGSEKIVDEQPEENSVAVTEEEAVEETEEVTEAVEETEAAPIVETYSFDISIEIIYFFRKYFFQFIKKFYKLYFICLNGLNNLYN